MISRGTPQFWRRFGELPAAVQKQARHDYRLFLEDPGHPSLNFKKLGGAKDFWSVRVGGKYRAVGERHGERIEWFWIGTHNDFDKLF